MGHRIKVARRQSIRGFTAEVLRENKSMQAVFDASGCKVKSRLTGNVTNDVLDFDRAGASGHAGGRRRRPVTRSQKVSLLVTIH